MESGVKGHFLVTHWPGQPVPEPAVWVPRLWGRAGEGLFVFGEDPDTEGPTFDDFSEVKLPHEAYLATFLPLAADDPKAVGDFCYRFGPVGRHGFLDLPETVREFASMNGEYQLPSPWAEAAQAPERYSGHPPRLWAVQNVAEVALHHAVLRDLVSLWRFLNDQLTLDELAASWSTPAGCEWKMPPTAWGRDWDLGGWIVEGPSDPKSDATRLLVEGLNPALEVFHVGISRQGSLPPWWGKVNAYQVMCLQLANHIAEGVGYVTCAAEDCSRLFVRTEGYSRYGQNRLRGNRFCSVTCANRQHKRESRRRQRAKGAKP